MDPLTASIVDTASALSAVRLHSEMSIRTLDKALDAESQMAMSLLEALPVPSPAGKGQLIDVVG